MIPNFQTIGEAEKFARLHQPYRRALEGEWNYPAYARQWGRAAADIVEETVRAVNEGNTKVLRGPRGLAAKLSFEISKVHPRFYEDRSKTATALRDGRY